MGYVGLGRLIVREDRSEDLLDTFVSILLVRDRRREGYVYEFPKLRVLELFF